VAGTGDLAAHARTLLDASCYLVLGTSDPDGRPWTSPVDFAADGLRDYYWVSATDARQPSTATTGRPCSGREGRQRRGTRS